MIRLHGFEVLSLPCDIRSFGSILINYHMFFTYATVQFLAKRVVVKQVLIVHTSVIFNRSSN